MVYEEGVEIQHDMADNAEQPATASTDERGNKESGSNTTPRHSVGGGVEDATNSKRSATIDTNAPNKIMCAEDKKDPDQKSDNATMDNTSANTTSAHQVDQQVQDEVQDDQMLQQVSQQVSKSTKQHNRTTFRGNDKSGSEGK